MQPAPKLPPVQADTETVCESAAGKISQTGKFFRDEQGRTRTEHGDTAGIQDPVKGHSFVLDLARKIAIPAPAKPGIPAMPGVSLPQAGLKTPQPPQLQETADLGEKVINGVRVQGKRYQLPAPPSPPGMPNPPQPAVSEVWTSPELQLPIQSTVTNPATGTTCVTQMKNVQPARPDLSMFQVPPDFQVVRPPVT